MPAFLSWILTKILSLIVSKLIGDAESRIQQNADAAAAKKKKDDELAGLVDKYKSSQTIEDQRNALKEIINRSHSA